MSVLPYFDMLIAAQRRGEPAALMFDRFVHWGYWDEPGAATGKADDLSAAMERLNDRILDAASLDGCRRLLDAGCGFGGTLSSVSRRHPRIGLCGVNIDERQIESARRRVPNAEFVVSDACATPFPDASFDRVLAVECVFHFPSRSTFLREAARLLGSGGLLVLSDFVPGDPTSPRASASPLHDQVTKGYGPIRGWDEGDYATMAADAGLRVEEDRDITANTIPTYPALLSVLSGLPEAEAMIKAIKLLEWSARSGSVRYRILRFRKP